MDIKPFYKVEPKIITVTFEANGDATYLATEASDIFLELGETVTRRASHVEPATPGARILFHFLRLFGNKTRIAEWTRGWKVLWRVNTSPVGGPILKRKDAGMLGLPELTAVWGDRQQAIDAEIKFLNKFFLEGR